MKRAVLTLLLLWVMAGASAQPCTYSMSPTDLSNIAFSGGARNIIVTTPTTCAVAVSSFQPWVTVNSIINNGATTNVSLQVAANNGAARSTSIKVADRLFLLTQDANGSGPWTGVCPGYQYTRLLVENWANPFRMTTNTVGGFGVDDIVVVQFTTGNSISGSNLLKIAGAEYLDPTAQRIATLSSIPCDFVGGTLQAYGGAKVPAPGSPSITILFTIENPNNFGYYPILLRNTTYYLNVKMPPDACPISCNMAFDLIKYDNQ